MEGSQAALLVAPAQIPDGIARHLYALGEQVDLRLVVLHREQDTCTAGDTLFDSAVFHKREQLQSVLVAKANPARWSASHRSRS